MDRPTSIGTMRTSRKDSFSPGCLAKIEKRARNFGSVQKRMTLYAADHPAIKPAIEKLNSLFRDALAASPRWSRDHQGGLGSRHADQARPAERSNYHARASFCANATWRSDLNSPLDQADLVAFLTIVNVDPQKIRDQGGILGLMKQKGIRTITAEELKYQIVDAKLDGSISEAEFFRRLLSAALEEDLDKISEKEFARKLAENPEANRPRGRRSDQPGAAGFGAIRRKPSRSQPPSWK